MNWLYKISLWAIPLLFAITVHEVAHGWIANKLGDPTAKMMGRITLNPIKHIDPLGTLIIPGLLLAISGFIFGWAKPVTINWQNLKTPRRDMALVAAAGPAANLLMAIGWGLIVKLISIYATGTNSISNTIGIIATIGILINLVLMVLNLIPIPPLDGSRLVSSFLSGKAAYQYSRLEPFGFFILLVLLALGILSKIILPIINYILILIANLLHLSPAILKYFLLQI